MEDYKKILKSEEYTFLHTNEHLGRHIILLGLAEMPIYPRHSRPRKT